VSTHTGRAEYSQAYSERRLFGCQLRERIAQLEDDNRAMKETLTNLLENRYP
jgi:hypothetical protein